MGINRSSHLDHFGLIENKQWQHYLMLSQLSDYHFLLNMLLVVISILQITVANERKLWKSEKQRLSRSNSSMSIEYQSQYAKSVRSLLSTSTFITGTKEGNISPDNPEEGSLEGVSFVDRVRLKGMEWNMIYRQSRGVFIMSTKLHPYLFCFCPSPIGLSYLHSITFTFLVICKDLI